MGVTDETNDEQAKLWKGIGGQGWVEAQAVLDQTPGVVEQTRERIFETVRAAVNPYVQGTEVRFNAACWTVGARA